MPLGGGSRAGSSLEEWCLLVLPEHLAGSAPHHLSQIKPFVIALEEENTSGRGFAACGELTSVPWVCAPLGAAEEVRTVVLLAMDGLLRYARQSHRLWLVQQQSKCPNHSFFPVAEGALGELLVC